ncbi:serine/threonine-protein kinase [Dokdonella sp.]|uniref:serine/threonine-protein kinase n=1 Tax=Dokdonella sp. TaxID=2291710 RepID=UPI001B27FAF5|nr:serine/threonine-protein kinase [Dokdonella sp.]MBO9661689.1 protein kinase [Dokdonella sp.]
MNTPSLDRYADDFERLRALPPAERETALAALPLDDEARATLRRLLDADTDADDPLARALGAGAARLAQPRGDRLGPYRLIRELGAGGMGTVFLAERVDGGFAQRVAIKLLRGFPTADGLRRLRQERQILAGLDHPHIARLLDGGETADGQPWLALEYVDGVDLLAYAAQHAPRLRERLALFDAMLDAVGHAHQRLVVHRDLKPANVLVNAAGEIKLLDFGIARLVDLDAGAARETSTRVFSAGYASPEQREGRTVTTASDLYSLGVLLGELVGGRADRERAPAPLPLDAELAGILAKATDEDPARRYASAGEFRDDLDRYRDGRPVRAAPMTGAYRLRKFVGRHRVGVAASLLAALALGLFVWRLDRERDRALAAEAVAQQARDASQRDAASARAALAFLTDAFKAAAPENALSRQVSVRDLLDAARRALDAEQADAQVKQTMQRLLARLYGGLGEKTIAVELMRAGLAGAQAQERGEALRLAADYDLLGNELTSADDGADALAAANTADALRKRYAPDDVIERMRSLLSLALARNRSGEATQAIDLLRQAIALSEQQAPPLDLEVELTGSLAGLLATNSDCDEAARIAERGLRRVAAVRPADAPERRELLRAQAFAMKTCGRWAEAEAPIREAIALQEKVIGSGGSDMASLITTLADVLTQLGRNREAAELLQRWEVAIGGAKLGDVEMASLLAYRADLLDAAGDYPAALDFDRQSAAALDRANVGADHQLRRQLRRNQARTLALSGDYARARSEFEDLLERAKRIDGENSIEYASVLWQLASAERLARRAEAGTAVLDEAMRRWTALAPPDHPIFAYARRSRAVFAMLRDDYATADREFAEALRVLEAIQIPPGDLATVRSERAELWRRQGRTAEARALLAQALPPLREAFLPNQVGRAGAERTAAQLGMK